MNFGSWFVRPLRAIHDLVMHRLRTSPLVARLLFGVKVPPSADALLWDYTTLVLRKAIRKNVRDGMRVWDVGCGPAAIVSLFVSRCARAEITASDREAACLTSASAAAKHMGVSLNFVESDLGQQIPTTFDLVIFNPPYLPIGNEAMMPVVRPRSGEEATVYNRRFGGGKEGDQTIARFLREIPGNLTPQGRVLLGFNTVYVPLERVKQTAVENGFAIVDCIRARLNPSRVLVLERVAEKNRADASSFAESAPTR